MAVISLPATGGERLADRVAAEIRALKGRHNVTQVQLAALLDLPQSGVSARLNGKRPFSLDEIERLAAFFGVDASELLGGTRLGPRPGGGPDGGQGVRHQGLEPRTRCYEAFAA